MNKILTVLIFLALIAAPAMSAQELEYNYESTYSIPIELTIIDEISTKDGMNEGDYIEFKAVNDVVYNEEKILTKNEIIKGRIETVITSGMNGFPAEITVKFEIPGIKDSQLLNIYSKEGTNRCFWVYPLKWSLTPIPFVGSLTNLIKGGHSIIKPTDVITIEYYPHWK
ncbi:MAG: hypothetical protein NC191_00430 [Muribaculaceae bacterium]|nr:hypothetical protein [Muribaculaceae bacterium]